MLGLRLGSLVKLHLHQDEKEEEEEDGSDGRSAKGNRRAGITLQRPTDSEGVAG